MTTDKKIILLRACDLAIGQLELAWIERGRPDLKDFTFTFEVRLEDDVVISCKPRGTLGSGASESVERLPRYERPEVL